MSRDAWRDSAKTDVLFPDDLEHSGPIQVEGEPVAAADAQTDKVEYGVVAALATEHDANWVVAPRELRAAIADCWREDQDFAALEILEAEKKGDEDHAEWSIDYRKIEEGDPL